ncbi:putative [Escherichia phage Mu]|uniref:Bacteriophage Mu left end n=1 Tax=Escherichia phage Mu TaxID=2681603 RepID=Q38476_BPMU|nr:putative [Escherichia phage Mu]
MRSAPGFCAICCNNSSSFSPLICQASAIAFTSAFLVLLIAVRFAIRENRRANSTVLLPPVIFE